MRRLITLILLAALPAPALAECVTRDTLERGVLFTRGDGRTGLAKRTVNSILIDYDIGKTQWDDRREAVYGIYETEMTLFLSDDLLIGSGSTDLTQRFGGTPPLPEAGTEWKTSVRGTSISYDSTEAGSSKGKGKSSGKATFRYLDTRDVTLSGCTYRMIPVEATFTRQGETRSQRWAYFPDLWFGLETVKNGTTLGLTMMKPL